MPLPSLNELDRTADRVLAILLPLDDDLAAMRATYAAMARMYDVAPDTDDAHKLAQRIALAYLAT